MYIIKCKWVKVLRGLKARIVVTLWGEGERLAGHQGVSRCWRSCFSMQVWMHKCVHFVITHKAEPL